MTEHLDKSMTAWRAGADPRDLMIGASTSQKCAFALVSGISWLLPEPFDNSGRAWLRLNDRQRAGVRRWNKLEAEYAEQFAHDALAEGIANHGSPLPPQQFAD